MITGSVIGRQPCIDLTLLVQGQHNIQIAFVVDTGFDGHLTLPPSVVAALGLTFVYHLTANLANDTDIELPVYEATILWHGRERKVQVLASGRRPLLGTLLMNGSDLRVLFAEDGPVTLQPLSVD